MIPDEIKQDYATMRSAQRDRHNAHNIEYWYSDRQVENFEKIAVETERKNELLNNLNNYQNGTKI